MTAENKLWLLRRYAYDGDPVYDCNDGFVVAAANEQEAREVAATDTHGDEGSDVWRDPHRASVEMIGTASTGRPTGVVLRDYHAG